MQFHCIEVSSTGRLSSPGKKIYIYIYSWTALAPEDEGTTIFEMAETSHPIALSHIVEDNPHQNCYETSGHTNLF
jgi:hypothetical protein